MRTGLGPHLVVGRRVVQRCPAVHRLDTKVTLVLLDQLLDQLNIACGRAGTRASRTAHGRTRQHGGMTAARQHQHHAQRTSFAWQRTRHGRHVQRVPAQHALHGRQPRPRQVHDLRHDGGAAPPLWRLWVLLAAMLVAGCALVLQPHSSTAGPPPAAAALRCMAPRRGGGDGGAHLRHRSPLRREVCQRLGQPVILKGGALPAEMQEAHEVLRHGPARRPNLPRQHARRLRAVCTSAQLQQRTATHTHVCSGQRPACNRPSTQQAAACPACVRTCMQRRRATSCSGVRPPSSLSSASTSRMMSVT